MFLDSSFLADLGRGESAAISFYEDNQYASYSTSTIVAYELFGGLVEAGGEDRLEDLRQDLDWVDFVDFTLEDAHESARLDAELLADGDRIPVADVLIAAAARNRGETLVAADEHFERVDGLECVNYRA